MWLLILCLLLFIFSILYLLLVRLAPGKQKSVRSKEESASVLIVIGSGGHTRESLTLVKALGAHYSPRYYVVAETDSISEQKVHQCENEKERENGDPLKDYSIFSIPRSREVKQSYLTSILTTAWAIIFSFPLVFKLRPDVILCNGPGTCIPVCVAGLCLKHLGLHNTMVVYVESFCRVTSMSLSGRLLYPFVHTLVVQWPELLQMYPKAKYLGKLI